MFAGCKDGGPYSWLAVPSMLLSFVFVIMCVCIITENWDK